MSWSKALTPIELMQHSVDLTCEGSSGIDRTLTFVCNQEEHSLGIDFNVIVCKDLYC